MTARCPPTDGVTPLGGMEDQPPPPHATLRLLPDPPTGDGSALPLLLAQLGDQASAMVSPGGDVRPHILACRAQHLAADVAALPGWPPPPPGVPPSPTDLPGAVCQVRRLVRGRLLRPLPEHVVDDLAQLITLAAAVTP